MSDPITCLMCGHGIDAHWGGCPIATREALAKVTAERDDLRKHCDEIAAVPEVDAAPGGGADAVRAALNALKDKLEHLRLSLLTERDWHVAALKDRNVWRSLALATHDDVVTIVKATAARQREACAASIVAVRTTRAALTHDAGRYWDRIDPLDSGMIVSLDAVNAAPLVGVGFIPHPDSPKVTE